MDLVLFHFLTLNFDKKVEKNYWAFWRLAGFSEPVWPTEYSYNFGICITNQTILAAPLIARIYICLLWFCRPEALYEISKRMCFMLNKRFDHQHSFAFVQSSRFLEAQILTFKVNMLFHAVHCKSVFKAHFCIN